MSEILAPVSFGELLDKVTILQIKSERMEDPVKVANVRKELDALQRIWNAHPASNTDISLLMARLKAVNERLWVIEDDIRILEKGQRFDNEFVQLARSVYFENDERAHIKKEICFSFCIFYGIRSVHCILLQRFSKHFSNSTFFGHYRICVPN